MALINRMLLASALSLVAAWAETTVFENFTLIDTRSSKAVPSSALVAAGGRITWVGPMSKLKAPPGAHHVDLAGKFVMPGLINTHGHIGNTVDLVQDPKFFTRDNVLKQLRVYASYGVTSTVTMGSEQPLILAIRDEQRATGRPKMARFFTARRGFTGKGGYPTTAPGMAGVPYEVETVAEVEKDVAELASQKADLVKIWVDDHLGKDKKISLDLCKAIIENGHKHGMKVVAHVFYLEDARKLVEYGLDGIVHSVRDKPVDQELIALMKKKGAWLGAATLTREASTILFAKPQPMFDDPFFQRAVSPAMLKTLRDPAFQKRVQGESDTQHGGDWLEMAKKNLKTMYDAGVKTGFGTDSGPPRRVQGYFEHLEMDLMAEAGLKPAQILQIATRNSADFLGARDIGVLESGRWADLLVLNANPLDNIRNVHSIHSVYVAADKVD